MKRQSGVSLIGVLILGAIAAFLFLLAMRAVPAYTEYMAVQKAVRAVAQEASPDTPATQIRRDFDKRAYIDEVSSVQGKDLAISKQGGKTVISVDYERRIPVVANISLVFAFSTSTAAAGAP